MKQSYNRDPLVAAAERLMVTEDVAKIQNKVAQLEVGDKTNFGVVKDIGPDSITFKAPYTPKTRIPFKQRKMGSADYLLMKLVKLTPDGKGLDKTFKESNEFVGAAAAAKVAGEDEFEFEGEKYPTKIGLAVAKKIMGEDNEVLESNEFVGAAAAAKVAGEDEFEFEGEKFPVEIGLAVAKKIMGESFSIEKDITEEKGSLKNSLAILAKAGVNGRFPNLEKLAQAIRKNYKAITGETYKDGDQVAMSEVIADLIVHYRLDGEDFIAAWDKTIKEATELEESPGKYSRSGDKEKYQWGDINKALMNAGIKPMTILKVAGQLRDKALKETVELEEAPSFFDSSQGAKQTYSNTLSLLKSLKKGSNLNKAVNKRLEGKYDSDFVKMEDAIELILDTLDGIDREYQMNEGTDVAELEERIDGEEWYTCETVVKSSGQLYSTFWVKAVDLRDANKKADKVFKEMINVSFPKGSENKFKLRVKKGENLGTLIADIMGD